MRPGLFRTSARPMVEREDGTFSPATDQEMLNFGHAPVGTTPEGQVWHSIGEPPEGAEVLAGRGREWSWLALPEAVAEAVLRKVVRLRDRNAEGGRDRVRVPKNAADPDGDTVETNLPPHEWI